MYDTYRHLLGVAYKAGESDCYGLARRYYKDLFGLDLLNMARPEMWWVEPDLNLITDCIFTDGWEDIGVNLRNLQIGDGLIFTMFSGIANHIGIYVGNGMFIHHVLGRFSCEEPLVQKWMSRCLMVVRHKVVTEQIKNNRPTLQFSEVHKNARFS